VSEPLSVAALAKKNYLVPSQRRQIEESINHLEFMLKDQETREVAMPNTDRIYANMQRDRQMLAEGTPPDYTPREKNQLNALRKKLEQDIQYGMPTADMMERPTPNNVDLHVWHEKANIERIKAWKNTCRSLDPLNDEPNFTSIARLRPSTPPKGNPRKYWQGFDAISWEERVEETMGTTIDDETYQTFIELKLLGWTSRTTICKELGLTVPMYEAAMERLRTSKAAQLVREPEPEPEPAPVATNGKAPDAAKVPTGPALKDAIEAVGLTVHGFSVKYGLYYNDLMKVTKKQAKPGPKMRGLILKGLEEEQRLRDAYAAPLDDPPVQEDEEAT
jgi:hypothetical protein